MNSRYKINFHCFVCWLVPRIYKFRINSDYLKWQTFSFDSWKWFCCLFMFILGNVPIKTYLLYFSYFRQPPDMRLRDEMVQTLVQWWLAGCGWGSYSGYSLHRPIWWQRAQYSRGIKLNFTLLKGLCWCLKFKQH